MGIQEELIETLAQPTVAEAETKPAKAKKKSGRPRKYADASQAYEAQKAKARARSTALTTAGRDIGDLPAPKDPARRESCRHDLRLFLVTYLPSLFPLEFSDDHEKAIKTIQQSILEGGRYCLSLPRGSGKSTIVLAAILWALLYGHKRLIGVACATMALAKESIEDLIRLFESRGAKLIHEDWPEAWYPLSLILGSPNKATGQLHKGKRTQIKWSDATISLPTIEGSICSGGTVFPIGLNTSVRGKKRADDEGLMNRVDMIFIDDPSTRQSANLPGQNDAREDIIESTLALLSGPGQSMSMLMACTVIAPNDVAERFLDNSASGHPDWRGYRVSAVKKMPSEEAMKLWLKYRELRATSLQQCGTIELATQFYVANQQAMSDGAEVYWDQRIEAPCIDALQTFMDVWAKNERTFWAELQNNPQAVKISKRLEPEARMILRRSSAIPIGIVPNWVTKIVAAVDVQATSLWWMVTGFSNEMQPHVITWGIYPDQRRPYVTKEHLQITLQQATGAPTDIDAWRIGLNMLASNFLERQLKDQDGTDRSVDLMLIDANWHLSTDVVYEVARLRGNGRILPVHGMPRTVKQRPISEFTIEKTATRGPGWYTAYGAREQIHLQIDPNFVKSWLYSQINASTGGLSVPAGTPNDLQLLADHLSSEYGIPITDESNDRTVVEWSKSVGRDNEFWDTLVYCSAGASYLGALLPGQRPPEPVKPVEYVRASDMQRQHRQQRHDHNRRRY